MPLEQKRCVKIGTISPPERRRAACAGWAAPRRRDVTTCRTGWRPRAAPGMAFGCVPPQRGWARRRSDALRVMAFEGAARDPVPTTMAAGCVLWDHVRGRSPRWPVQAEDACPATALGCGIRTGWRSDRSNHGVESGVGFSTQRLLVPAQRLAHQPRRHDRSGLRSC
jgi:hypothetical protein